MIIKCPECSTGYNIPDETLGEKPRKMKCAKCKNIFTLARRAKQVPAGYEEFTTGAGGLPPEFAFLKASVPPMSKSELAIPRVSDGGTFVGHVPTAPSFSERSPGSLVTAGGQQAPIAPRKPVSPTPKPPVVAPAPQPSVDASPEPASIQEPNMEASFPGALPPLQQANEGAAGAVAVAPNIAAGIPEEALRQAESPAAKAAVAELRQGGGKPVRNSLPAESMFGGGVSAKAWEVEAPMELGNFAVSQPPAVHHGHQLAGKVVFGVIVFLIVLFIFVAFRNGWSLSLSELPEQIGFAFSGDALEEIPDDAKEIEATVVSKKVITSSRGTYLIVSGEIVNNNPGSRSNVIVRGRLYDGKGDMRSEARMPCGHALDEREVRRTPQGRVSRHFMKNGAPRNCQIGPNDSRIFQVIFDDVPPDYDASFDVKVKTVSATSP